MLPKHLRLTSPADFRRTIRRGRRAGSRTVVVHRHDGAAGLARFGGPRVGLVVSKAVGNAVTRHRVSRQLRHAAGPILADLPRGADLVIRALPASAEASTERLGRDIAKALRKLERRRRG